MSSLTWPCSTHFTSNPAVAVSCAAGIQLVYDSEGLVNLSLGFKCDATDPNFFFYFYCAGAVVRLTDHCNNCVCFGRFDAPFAFVSRALCSATLAVVINGATESINLLQAA